MTDAQQNQVDDQLEQSTDSVDAAQEQVSEDQSSSPSEDQNSSSQAQQTPSVQDQNAKLFIGNLPFATTQDELRDLFSAQGEVTDVYIPHDRQTGRPRGLAFVTMATAEMAQAAIEALNGTELNGRQISVSVAQAREKSDRPRRFDRGGGFNNRGGGGYGGGNYGGGGRRGGRGDRNDRRGDFNRGDRSSRY